MNKKTKQRYNHIGALVHRHRKMMAYGLCLLFFAVAVGSSVYYRYRYIQAQTVIHTYPLRLWQPGDIVNDDRFIFSFNSLRTDTNGFPDYWEASPDQQFLMVNVSFKNLTDRDFPLSPVSSMSILDSSLTSYPVTSAPFIVDSIGGPVQPGQTVRGEVGFTVPKTVTSGTFIFNPGLVDSHLIKVHFSL